MTIKNSDLPAMPVDTKTFYDSHQEIGSWEKASLGLTKREMFAKDSPSCPDFYRRAFISSNPSLCIYNTKTGIDDKLSFDGEMKLIKKWRYEYADLMLED